MNELTSKVWSSDEIQRGLRQIPALAARKAEEIAEKRAELQEMEHAVKLMEAGATIEIAKSDPKATATLLKAIGYVQTDRQRRETFAIQKELAVLEAQHRELDDTFNAIRKQANLTQEEMRQYGYGGTKQ